MVQMSDAPIEGEPAPWGVYESPDGKTMDAPPVATYPTKEAAMQHATSPDRRYVVYRRGEKPIPLLPPHLRP